MKSLLILSVEKMSKILLKKLLEITRKNENFVNCCNCLDLVDLVINKFNQQYRKAHNNEISMLVKPTMRLMVSITMVSMLSNNNHFAHFTESNEYQECESNNLLNCRVNSVNQACVTDYFNKQKIFKKKRDVQKIKIAYCHVLILSKENLINIPFDELVERIKVLAPEEIMSFNDFKIAFHIYHTVTNFINELNEFYLDELDEPAFIEDYDPNFYEPDIDLTHASDSVNDSDESNNNIN